jgi:DNA-binding transcriptional LysR family regulator
MLQNRELFIKLSLSIWIIDMTDISRLDLTLATTFQMIWEERSVSRAAVRLSLSQSAVSAALARLRSVCDDPLFIRTRGGMEPTPRAIQMAGAVEQGIDLLREALLGGRGFDPATSTAHFSIGMSDDYEVAIGPLVSRTLIELAPGVSVVFRQSNRHTAEKMLEARDIDIAISGALVDRGRVVATPLGQSGYACLVDPKAVKQDLPLTLEKYLSLPHILVSFSGREGIVDTALQAIGETRRVQTALTHFSTLPRYLRGVRAVATIPVHAAHALARESDLKVLPVPVSLPDFDVAVYRRRDMESDAALSWLIAIVSDAFAEVAKPSFAGVQRSNA